MNENVEIMNNKKLNIEQKKKELGTLCSIGMLEDYGIELFINNKVNNKRAEELLLKLINSDVIKEHIETSIKSAIMSDYVKSEINMLTELIYRYGNFDIINMRFMKKFLTDWERSRLRSFLQEMEEFYVIYYVLKKRSIEDGYKEMLKEYFDIIKNDPVYDQYKTCLPKYLKKKLDKYLDLALEDAVDIACNAS